MTGKQHSTIGISAGAIASYTYLGGDFSPVHLVTVVGPVVVGSFIGSYLPDIDSKKSKASQAFNKILLAVILSLGVAHYLELPILEEVMGFVKNTFLGNLGLLMFLVNTVLGKLSGHRLYTHRIVGTGVFVVSSLLAFNSAFAYGLILGYLLHIAADRTTADGKNLKFFRIQLPMTNSKGKLHVSF